MIVGVGGPPGTGKTTLTNLVLAKLGAFSDMKYRSLRFRFYEHANVAVLGVYELGKIYSGTDALSMGVQPDAVSFFKNLQLLFKNSPHIFFEGDRLFNGKFFDFLATLSDQQLLIVLQTQQNELLRRYMQRGSAQDQVWLKGRHTKYANILSSCSRVHALNNNTLEDQTEIVKLILHNLGCSKSVQNNL